MKLTIATLALTIFTLPAFAGNRIQDLTAATGAEVMVREVLEKNLLAKDGVAFNGSLKAALEGSHDGITKVYMTSISCEAALGSTYCTIHFYDVENEGQDNQLESSFDLLIRLYQGKVVAASIENLAG